jgi:hypothetical protein
MLRCNHCNTTWFARVSAANPFMKEGGESPYLAARRLGRLQFERIVEHDTTALRRQAQGQPVRLSESGQDGMSPTVSGLRSGRRHVGAWFGAIAAVVIGGLVTVLALQSAVVGAAPAVEMAQFAGLEIRLVSATVEPVHNQNTVIVVGEIANRSGGDLAVPAVRIAVRSGGTERHAWLHQPGQTRLSAGEALTFRSFLTSPPAGIDEVTFRLAQRSNAAAEVN